MIAVAPVQAHVFAWACTGNGVCWLVDSNVVYTMSSGAWHLGVASMTVGVPA